MNNVFKNYDIRGLYPKEINEKIAYKIGRAFVKFTNAKKVVVGRDVRISSASLASSFIKGVLDEGANVVNIGKCTASIFYFTIAFFKYDAGAMITASHNPKNYNGFKLCGKRAEVYGYENGLNKIEAIVMKSNFKEIKSKNTIEKKDVFPAYKKFILKFAKGLKKHKIVADYGNGAEALFGPKIFLETNLKVVNINDKVNGNFPAHGPDPSLKGALKQLSRKVKKEKAELGIALDADADRIFFVDETGEEIRADHILAFVIEEILKNKEGKIFVYDASCSKIIKEIIKKYNGKAILSKVGRTNVRKKCVENNADFGGELSGHYFLKEYFNSENGLLVLFRILHYMEQEKKKLSQLLKPYKKYFQVGPINLNVKDKEIVLKKIKKYYDKEKIDALDGVRVEHNGWRFILRASNTEPLIRLVIEGKNKKEVEKQKKELLKLMKNDKGRNI